MNPPRRIVITGMGVVTAAGHTLDELWKNTVEGRSGIGKLTRFDPKDSPVRIAAEVNNFDAADLLGHKLSRRLDRSLQLGLTAGIRAMEDAGISACPVDADRCGVIEGTTLSNNPAAYDTEFGFLKRGMRGVRPSAMINGYSGGGSGEMATILGLRGPALTCSTGSASGNDAIGLALALLRQDEADVLLAGGAESPLLRSAWGGFSRHRLMSTHNDTPQRAMAPFDKQRNGFALGEGAGFLVLEALEHALARGAKMYAEVLGHGRSVEAYNPVAPHPDGDGIVRAISLALRRSRVLPEEVDYINCHGTATELNDPVEARGIRRFFNEHASRVLVSSTKPITGHLMAAAGAVESVLAALSLYHGVLPLTLNLKQPDEECALAHIREKSQPYPARIALNLNSGFGGRNACLVLGSLPLQERSEA